MITLEELAVCYGDNGTSTLALSGVNEKVGDGEWVGLIGPNGAGKTTLLRSIVQLIPHEGRTLVDGQDTRALSRRELARLIAYVPQKPELPPEITVSDYVLLGRSPHVGYFGVEGAHDHAVCAALLERLELSSMAERHLGTLSGGELQRLVLARALAQEAPVLLLDEPTSALDLGRRVDALEIVDALRREHGLTVLSAMHDLTLAGQFADRLVLLSDGKVVASGRSDEVLNEALLTTHFGLHVQVLRTGEGDLVVAPRRRGASPQGPEERGEPMSDEHEAVSDEAVSDEAGREAEPEEVAAPGVRVPSLVLVNTGHGKGKSSAAFGVMGRAWARGWTVGVVQFVKGGKWQVGERKLADHLGIEWQVLGDGFTWESTDLDETAAKGRHAWSVARAKLASGAYDMLILDELTYAVSYGWVPVADVVAGVLERAPKTNVVITGRNAAPELIEIADTVTEMTMVKHAYERGIKARKGIEY